MIDRTWAEQFAKEWIDAWNSHDLDRILSHYVEDFEMSSPLIIELKKDPSGVLRGKTAIIVALPHAHETVMPASIERVLMPMSS